MTTAWQLIRVALFFSDSVLYFIFYLAFPRRVSSSFSRVFCLTCPHILLSKLALVKLEILERSVIENWPLEVLAKNICSEKNNRTENVGGKFLDRDFVRKKEVKKRKGMAGRMDGNQRLYTMIRWSVIKEFVRLICYRCCIDGERRIVLWQL